MMTNEKPGGHGERSVAVGVIDMAVWDAVAKIAGKPLYRLLAERHGTAGRRRVFVYAAGGYYYPGKDVAALQDEMRSYRGPRLRGGQDEDRRRAARRRPRRIEAVLEVVGDAAAPRRRRQRPLRSRDRDRLRRRRSSALRLFWYEEPGDPLDYALQADVAEHYPGPHGDRREPLLHQDARNLRALRRHAPRPRLAAVRLRAELRPGRIPAHPRRCCGTRLVARARIPHGGHQMSLNIAAGLGLGGNESYPDLFQPFGGFADGIPSFNLTYSKASRLLYGNT
jgi:D(-)-tartrate dehydratase